MVDDAQVPRPSAGELDILRVLWQRGPSTVHEVHEALEKKRRGGYGTYLKLLQIMAQKGLAKRNESQRAHVYEAAVSEEATEHELVKDMLDRCFEGRLQRLILRALESKRVSEKELEEIRGIMDSFD